MAHTACALWELSKPEERSHPREREGEAAEARDKETHANEATTTEDPNAKRNTPTRTDNDEEGEPGDEGGAGADPTPCQSETRDGMNETASLCTTAQILLRTPLCTGEDEAISIPCVRLPKDANTHREATGKHLHDKQSWRKRERNL